MPVRNTVRVYSPESYFHVYNRGVEGRKIFIDDEDYAFFVRLFARHLSIEQQVDATGTAYKHYYGLVDINAYCLMPNHFHLLLYQHDDTHAISRLMASVITAYSMYFNKKYKRRGPLFENRFKASPIFENVYLLHNSRYIHLNPNNFKKWQHSSYQAYVGKGCPEWLHPGPIMELFGSSIEQYREFVADYEDVQRQNDLLKSSFADT